MTKKIDCYCLTCRRVRPINVVRTQRVWKHYRIIGTCVKCKKEICSIAYV